MTNCTAVQQYPSGLVRHNCHRFLRTLLRFIKQFGSMEKPKLLCRCAQFSSQEFMMSCIADSFISEIACEDDVCVSHWNKSISIYYFGGAHFAEISEK